MFQYLFVGVGQKGRFSNRDAGKRTLLIEALMFPTCENSLGNPRSPLGEYPLRCSLRELNCLWQSALAQDAIGLHRTILLSGKRGRLDLHRPAESIEKMASKCFSISLPVKPRSCSGNQSQHFGLGPSKQILNLDNIGDTRMFEGGFQLRWRLPFAGSQARGRQTPDTKTDTN